MLILGLLGFVMVGLALGLLGGGGSILAVPVLVYLFGLTASVAVPMSLPVVGLTAAFGAWRKHRAGHLQIRRAVIFAALAMTTSFAAARLGAGIPDRPRLLLFAMVLLVAAAVMWRRSLRTGSGSVAEPAANPGTFSITLIVAALAVGALTGLVGVGGGFLMVPVLVGVLGLPMMEATATSLAVIALNAGAASLGWIGRVSLDWLLMAMILAAAMSGMLMGIRIAPRFSTQTLSRVFAALLMIVAAVMLGQELGH
jgi:uncharacterized membrane protein YfcA